MARIKIYGSFLLVITIIFLYSNIVHAEEKPKNKDNISVLVDISEERLYLIDTKANEILKTYRIASGRAVTPSPVGTWRVTSLGKWSGGFGSRWIGLNVPWGRYGIHGTNRPDSIGSEASHGCIRMLNCDVEDLYEYMQNETIVTVYAGPYGPFEKGLNRIIPGDRGSAVLEVQRKMKNKGYYPGYMDGIYGDGMKKFVIKFRADNKLSTSHDIDKEFYKKIGIELID